MEHDDIIEAVISTLESIEVHGKNNLSMLLGCINVLEDIIAKEKVEEKTEE